MQTSVGARPSIGVPGDIASLSSSLGLGAAVNEEASAEIAFGLMVAAGVADGGSKLLALNTDALLGIAVRAHDYAQPSELGATGVKPATIFGLMRRGATFVIVEDAVTPASDVYVRCTAGQGSAALVVNDMVFTALAATDEATALNHGLLTGDGPIRVANSGGGLPAGLAAATDYWVIRVDDNKFKFATTRALALAGTAINLTSDGTGVQTLSDTAATERVVSGLAGGFRGTPDGSPLVVNDFTFTAAADDIITATAHGLNTGDGPIQVSNSGGVLPAGLVAATNYWVVRLTANTFKVATTRASALATVPVVVDITGAGTGTHTVSDTVDTERLTTVNISAFARFKRTAAIGKVCEVSLDMINRRLATL